MLLTNKRINSRQHNHIFSSIYFCGNKYYSQYICVDGCLFFYLLKVYLSLCHEGTWGCVVTTYFYIFNLGARCRGEWSASRSYCFVPRRRRPRYPLNKRLGLRVSLDAVEKRNISNSCREYNNELSVVHPVA
jgi:hypothetical protein